MRTTRLTRFLQEIGFTHMRILEGVGTLIQLGGLMARLCKMVRIPITSVKKMLINVRI